VPHLSLARALTAGLVLAALLPASASAHTVQAGTAATPQGRLFVHVDVNRFRATRAGTQADGTATATLRGLGQLPTTVHKKVHLAAKRSGRCTVLTLQLDTLDLTLLGLNVHLDKVKLAVTGRSRSGVLGSLFCSLARAKVKAARASAARRLNTAIRKHGRIRTIGVGVPVKAVTAQAAPTCSVLDLVLGPLHVDLLGLFVDLNRVHLTITANPTGGVLGRLFCGLANTRL
jgi:hypothetical protein